MCRRRQEKGEKVEKENSGEKSRRCWRSEGYCNGVGGRQIRGELARGGCRGGGTRPLNVRQQRPGERKVSEEATSWDVGRSKRRLRGLGGAPPPGAGAGCERRERAQRRPPGGGGGERERGNDGRGKARRSRRAGGKRREGPRERKPVRRAKVARRAREGDAPGEPGCVGLVCAVRGAPRSDVQGCTARPRVAGTRRRTRTRRRGVNVDSTLADASRRRRPQRKGMCLEWRGRDGRRDRRASRDRR